jgi:hypothetical protein
MIQRGPRVGNVERRGFHEHAERCNAFCKCRDDGPAAVEWRRAGRRQRSAGFDLPGGRERIDARRRVNGAMTAGRDARDAPGEIVLAREPIAALLSRTKAGPRPKPTSAGSASIGAAAAIESSSPTARGARDVASPPKPIRR